VVYTIVIRPEDHMIFGAENISRIIKRNANEIPDLVKKQGLVAWQDGPKGKWRALCADLLEFNRLERERNLPPCQ
jgi:2-polyprenyl-3-methyl-5-hydroxy-6-metoxy-1,4-benzoquinol methylase